MINQYVDFEDACFQANSLWKSWLKIECMVRSLEKMLECPPFQNQIGASNYHGNFKWFCNFNVNLGFVHPHVLKNMGCSQNHIISLSKWYLWGWSASGGLGKAWGGSCRSCRDRILWARITSILCVYINPYLHLHLYHIYTYTYTYVYIYIYV